MASKSGEGMSKWIRAENDGCDVVERCLECPLRQCRFDDELWFRRQVQVADAVVLDRMLREERLTMEGLAGRLGRSVRVIHRRLVLLRDSEEVPEGKALEGLLRVGKVEMAEWN